jgi:hypothetical protein
MTADKRAEAAEVEALFDCECGHGWQRYRHAHQWAAAFFDVGAA